MASPNLLETLQKQTPLQLSSTDSSVMELVVVFSSWITDVGCGRVIPVMLVLQVMLIPPTAEEPVQWRVTWEPFRMAKSLEISSSSGNISGINKRVSYSQHHFDWLIYCYCYCSCSTSRFTDLPTRNISVATFITVVILPIISFF